MRLRARRCTSSGKFEGRVERDGPQGFHGTTDTTNVNAPFWQSPHANATVVSVLSQTWSGENLALGTHYHAALEKIGT